MADDQDQPKKPKFYSVSVVAVARRDQDQNPFYLVGDWAKKGVQVKVGDPEGIKGLIVTEEQLTLMAFDPFIKTADAVEVADPSSPAEPVAAAAPAVEVSEPPKAKAKR